MKVNPSTQPHKAHHTVRAPAGCNQRYRLTENKRFAEDSLLVALLFYPHIEFCSQLSPARGMSWIGGEIMLLEWVVLKIIEFFGRTLAVTIYRRGSSGILERRIKPSFPVD